MDKQAYLDRWHDMNRVVHDIVMKHKGSFSAEHGIGILKRGDMQRYKSGVELDVMRSLKQALDPKGILNPGRGVALRPPSGLRPPPPAKLREGEYLPSPTCWGRSRRGMGASQHFPQLPRNSIDVFSTAKLSVFATADKAFATPESARSETLPHFSQIMKTVAA